MRIFKSHPLLSLVNGYLVDSPQPSNLSYLWNFGSLLAFCLIIQIVTGVTLAMHYNLSWLEVLKIGFVFIIKPLFVVLFLIGVYHTLPYFNNGMCYFYTSSNTSIQLTMFNVVWYILLSGDLSSYSWLIQLGLRLPFFFLFQSYIQWHFKREIFSFYSFARSIIYGIAFTIAITLLGFFLAMPFIILASYVFPDLAVYMFGSSVVCTAMPNWNDPRYMAPLDNDQIRYYQIPVHRRHIVPTLIFHPTAGVYYNLVPDLRPPYMPRNRDNLEVWCNTSFRVFEYYAINKQVLPLPPELTNMIKQHVIDGWRN